MVPFLAFGVAFGSEFQVWKVLVLMVGSRSVDSRIELNPLGYYPIFLVGSIILVGSLLFWKYGIVSFFPSHLPQCTFMRENRTVLNVNQPF